MPCLTRYLRLAFVAPVLVGALAGCRHADRGEPPARTSNSDGTHRRFLSAPVDTLWTVALSDSSVDSPAFLTADDARVYLTDPPNATVSAFDLRTGRREWSRAVSPAHPRALTALRRGGVAFAEEAGGSIGFLDAAGTPGAPLVAPAVSPSSAICELADGAFLVSNVNGGHALAVVDRAARIRRAVSLPWPDLREPITAQLWLAPTPESCVGALAYGRGFATFRDSAFGSPVPYVEAFDVPTVGGSVAHAGDTTITQRFVTTHRVAALDVAADREFVAVSFDGTTDARGHVVDYYRTGDGAYVGSRRLARRVIALTMHDGVAVTIARTPDGYLLAGWRDRGLAPHR